MVEHIQQQEDQEEPAEEEQVLIKQIQQVQEQLTPEVVEAVEDGLEVLLLPVDKEEQEVLE